MRKTFKYKAKLSKTTEQNAFNWLGYCQKLYNLALEQRITAYKRCGVSLSTYDQHSELPEFKKALIEFKLSLPIVENIFLYDLDKNLE